MTANTARSAVTASGAHGQPLVQARDSIAMMAGYHSPQLDVEVRLNTNESPYSPPAEFTRAVAQAVLSVQWNRYPDRRATELRQRIAARHGVGPECVFVANGTNEVLQSLLLAYGGPGRTVVTFEPTYSMHGHLTRVTGAALRQGERGADFALEASAATEVIATSKPSVTFLCSPDNPTGVLTGPETVAEVLDAVRAAGGLLCVDEAYGEFARCGALEFLASDPDCPLAVTRTYSKAWAMAALRLGYLVAPSWVVDQLFKVVLPYHLDSVKQAAGIAALDHSDAMAAVVEATVAERARLTAGLGKLPAQVWPSGANFVLFRPKRFSGAEVWQRLVERSVLVRDCSSWPRLRGCLRVTVGTPAENDRFLSALSAILK